MHERALLDTPFDALTDEERHKKMLKWHLGSQGKSVGARRSYDVADITASIQATLGKRDAFVDLVAQINADLGGVFGKRDASPAWDEFSTLASSLGVSPEQIEAAKKAASENLSAEQQADVQNAVKHALWSSRHHGERSGGGSAAGSGSGSESGEAGMPGPAFLFRMRDVEEEDHEDEGVVPQQGGGRVGEFAQCRGKGQGAGPRARERDGYSQHG